MPEVQAAQERILEIMRGFFESRAMALAAEFEIADLLAEGPLDIDSLAQLTRTDTSSLFRLMRALESVGLFAQVSPRVFANTPASAVLRRNAPGSQWTFVRTILSTGFGQYDSWAEAKYSVETGKTGLEKLYGCGPWDFMTTRPEIWSIFNDAMRAASAAISPAVAVAYDWKRFSVVADIGGGVGSQLVAILDAHPSVRGVLFDAEPVIAQAISHDRMERVAGDFFRSVPPGADAYILRWILHDWPDDESLAILNNVRKAVRLQSRIVLIEEIIPETAELTWAKWLDLHMLVVTGGRERTASEYKDLYAKSGFDLERIVPTSAGSSLIIGQPRA
jgi:O-methyltransferase domain/Dimerisation domain